MVGLGVPTGRSEAGGCLGEVSSPAARSPPSLSFSRLVSLVTSSTLSDNSLEMMPKPMFQPPNIISALVSNA